MFLVLIHFKSSNSKTQRIALIDVMQVSVTFMESFI